MVTAIGSTLSDAIKAFVKPSPRGKSETAKRIAASLERSGFSRQVGGVNFFRFIRAIKRAQEEHKGVLFTGPNGVGKSFAMRIYYQGVRTTRKEWIDCNSAIALGWLDQPFLDDMCVFIDDFGGERMLYGDQDLVGAFIVRWHTYHVPNRIMCMTTNLTYRQIDERYGGRVLDRINDLCVICKFEGESRRGSTVVK